MTTASMILATAGLLAAVPAAAQAPVPAAPVPAPVDPARLAAAQRVVDAAMPPATRAGMIKAMVTPMMDNIRASFASSPQMAELTAKQPQARAVFDAFLQRTIQSTMSDVDAAMPKLIAAMATAYARNLTLAQLNETAVFYASPAGRALVTSLPAITADPAVLQVQREMMTAAFARMPEQAKQLRAELAALEKAKP